MSIEIKFTTLYNVDVVLYMPYDKQSLDFYEILANSVRAGIVKSASYNMERSYVDSIEPSSSTSVSLDKVNAAIKTLEKMGYTHTGGELWRPPIGTIPDYAKEAGIDIDSVLTGLNQEVENRKNKMRTINDHVITDADNALTVLVVDEPGHGGANHSYHVIANMGKGITENTLNCINFQNGPVKEHGINGLTESVLLTILMDRMRSFQKGDFQCRENQMALNHMEEALHWLEQRTIARLRRGVEGTNVK